MLFDCVSDFGFTLSLLNTHKFESHFHAGNVNYKLSRARHFEVEILKGTKNCFCVTFDCPTTISPLANLYLAGRVSDRRVHHVGPEISFYNNLQEQPCGWMKYVFLMLNHGTSISRFLPTICRPF